MGFKTSGLKRSFTFNTRFGIFRNKYRIIRTFFTFFHFLGGGGCNNACSIRFAFAFLVAGSGKSSNQ